MSINISDSLIFTPITANNVSAVSSIEQAASPYPWSEETFRNGLAVGFFGFVAYESQHPAGYIFLSCDQAEGHILNFAVHPEYQRRGIGHSLLTYAVSYLKSQNISELFLEVRVSNKAALTLYQQFGFMHVATRPRYYPTAVANEYEDAWVMKKE